MTSRFSHLREYHHPLRHFIEVALPQRTLSVKSITDDLEALWVEGNFDTLNRRQVYTCSGGIVYSAYLFGEQMYVGVRSSDNPSYRDIFYVGIYEELILPKISKPAITFFHSEKFYRVDDFSVADFMLFLLRRHSTIVSDKGQSSEGATLWRRFVSKAYSKKLIVALFDTEKSAYIDISNQPNYVERNVHKIWGNTEEFKHIRLLVTTEALPK